jgi:hypothetical protein
MSSEWDFILSAISILDIAGSALLRDKSADTAKQVYQRPKLTEA